MRVLLPTRPPRGWIVAAAVTATLGVLALVLPRWIERRATAAVVARVEARTGLPMQIGSVGWRWGRVRLDDVQVGGGPDQPSFRFDRVFVGFERASSFGTDVDLIEVVVDGGSVEASVDQLRDLATRGRGADEETSASPEPEQGEGRSRRLPQLARVAGLKVRLHDPGRSLAVEATVRADAALAERRAGLWITDVALDQAGKRRADVASVRADIQLDDGLRPQFPVRAEFTGAGAPLRPHLAIAGAEGWIEASDRNFGALRMQVAGSFAEESRTEEAGPKLWSVAGDVRRDLSAGRITLDMDPFALGRVPAVLERLPVADSAEATVGGHVSVVFADGRARAEGDLALAGLNVDHPTLARTVVRDVGFRLGFAAEVDPRASRVDLVYAEIDRDGVVLDVAGTVEHPRRREGRRYDVSAQIQPVACQRVLEAIPEELVPALARFELSGTFAARADADIDYARLDALTLQAKIGIDGCRIRRTPPHAEPRRLAGGFIHRVQLRSGEVRELELYAGSSDFTPFSEISPYMVQAVLTTEDGGFWRHHGFLPSQFEVALRRNLSEDRIRLGASTITMQMVKNVLLSHERTLARKLQELFLTWYVETAIGKERILELYLNAIEYGPAIYGITHAAKHYFGKRPIDLTPPEAAYLALMLPSPVRRHAHYCQGQLSDAFRIKLQRILSIMHQRERLSDLEYEVWKDQPITFDASARSSTRACMQRIEVLSRGEYTQKALSGLLGMEPSLDPRPRRPESADLGEEVEIFDEDPADMDAPGSPAMDDLR